MKKKVVFLACWWAFVLGGTAHADGKVELLTATCRLFDTRNIGGANAGAKVQTATIETTAASLDVTAYTIAAVTYNSQGGQTGCKAPFLAKGLIANLTVVSPDGPGYARLWPYSEPEPLPVAITFASGQTDESSGLVIMTGYDGKVSVSLPVNAAHVVVDVTAWVVDGAKEGPTRGGVSGNVASVTVVDQDFTIVELDSGSKIWCQSGYMDPSVCEAFTVNEHVAAVGRLLVDAKNLTIVADHAE